MPDTALGGALPPGDANGLQTLASAMIADPSRLRVILCLIDCAKVTTKTDSGTQTATARIRRIEVVLPDDLGAAERLIRRALEKRTGATVLPLDLEDELREAFAELAGATDAELTGDDDDGPAEDDPADPEDGG